MVKTTETNEAVTDASNRETSMETMKKKNEKKMNNGAIR